MSFQLPYLTQGQRQRSITLPDFYMGFVSTEDANQLQHGLYQKNQHQPNNQQLKQSAINLARQRKEHTA